MATRQAVLGMERASFFYGSAAVFRGITFLLDGARTATVAHRAIAAYVTGVARGSPWSERVGLTPAEAAEERVLLGLRTVEGATAVDLATLGLHPDRAPLISGYSRL